MRKIRTVAIYGGYFNPVAYNHIAVAKEIKKYIDEVWMMPVGIHKFGNKEIMNEEHRINMLNIMWDGLSKRDKNKICLNFSQLEAGTAPQNTRDLMNWLRSNYNGVEFYVAIGSDNADVINEWAYYEDLLKENKFIIVNRENKCRYTPASQFFNNKNVIKVINTVNDNKGKYKSSTEIRDMISKGEVWEAKKYCPAKVVDYAVEHNLYPSKKILKVGLDYHGICDLYPEIFASLSASLIKVGQEVHIITGKTNNQELRDKLAEYGIKYTCIFSITDWLEENGQVPTIDEKGGKVFKLDLWNGAKADYCRRRKIDLMIDDSEEYGKYFTTPYLKLKGGSI